MTALDQNTISLSEIQKRSDGKAILGSVYVAHVFVLYLLVWLISGSGVEGLITKMYPVFPLMMWFSIGISVVLAARPALFKYINAPSSFLFTPLFLIWPVAFLIKSDLDQSDV